MLRLVARRPGVGGRISAGPGQIARHAGHDPRAPGGGACPPYGPGRTGPRAPACRRAEATLDAVNVSDTELARRIIEEEQERLGVGGQRP